MISVKASGSFSATSKFLAALQQGKMYQVLDRRGKEGVRLLKNATPKESGETANSWSYKVTHTPSKHVLSFHNSHIEDGVPIAIILQYGHGTGTGGYVQGVDYVNPALKDYFDKIVDEVWREVNNA